MGRLPEAIIESHLPYLRVVDRLAEGVYGLLRSEKAVRPARLKHAPSV